MKARATPNIPLPIEGGASVSLRLRIFHACLGPVMIFTILAGHINAVPLFKGKIVVIFVEAEAIGSLSKGRRA